ncbi:MAG: hypothetical protein KC680_00815 [Candidatus Peregrinibacteria bacterium]|nr:hypothetical protein [Candidatus Peregrinibacteria bacterium]MCB9808081.1 hypothetical protein [Candidatus Peribacteria bacterium]
MEKIFDIPILRSAYDLYKTFHGLRGIVSKADRYTLWHRKEPPRKKCLPAGRQVAEVQGVKKR